MQIRSLLIDLDDTIYPASNGVWQAIRQRIDAFICAHFDLPPAQALQLRDELFRKYGTTMRGLQVEYHLDEEEYLKFVHDVPLETFLSPQPALSAMLSKLPYPKNIFTNADTRHALRVMGILGVRSCFNQIIDIRAIAPYCKPMPEAFEIALNRIGEKAEHCALVEDSRANLITAKRMGFFTIHVGDGDTCEECDSHIKSIMELPEILILKES